MTKLCLHAALICLLVAVGIDTLASDMYFQESIDDSLTSRVTRLTDGEGVIWWEENLPGDSHFGVATDSLSYAHSITGIDPPVLPNGALTRVRLKLYLRNHSKEDVVLTVDSLDFDQINRRHFLIGPDQDDSITVQESQLADGSITIVLEGDDADKQFVLHRSVFDMTYRPDNPTDVPEPDDIRPGSFELGANYPNPFNPSTTIMYMLPSQSHVRIEVLNALGRLVKTLVDETKPSGSHTVTWDGTDNTGTAAASGIYFYRIKAGDFIDARKMLLLK